MQRPRRPQWRWIIRHRSVGGTVRLPAIACKHPALRGVDFLSKFILPIGDGLTIVAKVRHLLYMAEIRSSVGCARRMPLIVCRTKDSVSVICFAICCAVQ
jgi:hypothetical protein